ncbi:uncharacterized protein [Antedon mediterranea]|uniref:uncharacterized protein n=1 Tax=Antedon mediterranea TaxID=105859 RepID=UPI003AF64202
MSESYYLVKWLQPRKDKGSISHVLRNEIDSEAKIISVGITIRAKYVRKFYKAEVIEVCESEKEDDKEDQVDGNEATTNDEVETARHREVAVTSDGINDGV